jgi:hypothetical protein
MGPNQLQNLQLGDFYFHITGDETRIQGLLFYLAFSCIHFIARE